ncbi:MAG: serine hydrolase [Gemmatimonadales bacterium]|nr:serine hydrolase [Gemmatimonadales bacterium]
MPASRSAAFVLALLTLGTPLSAQQARPSPNALAAAVDSLARRVVDAQLTPALGVALVMDGVTIHIGAYGTADVTRQIPATHRSLWYVASTSKSYTGFAAALLASEGVLRFDQSMTALLPDARWPAGVDANALTLARFLSHTHFLADNSVVMNAAFTGEIPEARWPLLLQDAKPTGKQDLVYSNLGYNVAAMVIDAKRPEGWRGYLDSAVYRPAGMHETYARISGLDPRRIAMPHELTADGRYATSPFYKTDATMNSAGGHLATLGDLARWVTVQMDGGVIDGRRAFSAAAVELSQRLIAPHTLERGRRFGPFDREGWAAGWDIGSYRGERMISRFGGYMTIRSHLSFLPVRRIGVVAQATGGDGPAATDILAQYAYDLEAGRPDARSAAYARIDSLIAQRPATLRRIAEGDSVRRARQVPLDRPLAGWAGSYANPSLGTITFTRTGDALAFRWGAMHGPVEIFDAAKWQMRIEVGGSGTVVSFDFPASGPAASITINGATFLRVSRDR